MSILNRAWGRLSNWYSAKVGRELSRHGESTHTQPTNQPTRNKQTNETNLAHRTTGLMYEDALVETEEVKLALSRLPPHLLNAREQRLKRAMVLSSQQKEVSHPRNL